MKKLLAVLFLCSFSISRLWAQATVDPELRTALRTNPLAQVIVTFNGSGAPSPTQVGLLARLGILKGVTLRALPIAGVLATALQVEALALRPEVRSIYLNKRLTYFNFDDTHLTGVKRLRADKSMTARNNGSPISGKGIGVLINDSGVDGTHDDIKFGSHLVQNTLGSTNLNSLSSLLPVTYIEGIPNTDNNSGHGTHCAGTVGGNGTKSGGKYEGVAPGASLLGYGSGAALLVLDAIGGFDYALTHQYQYNIRVISNSFGTSGTFDPNDPLNIATKKAYDRGMVVVFAAGNEGPGADTHNPYAIAPWVISVGAGDRYGRLAEFSSRGVLNEGGSFTVDGESWSFKNEPTIVAPGVDVVSTRVIGPIASLGIQQDVETLEPAHVPFYTHMSGTSMATPHLAGVVALMLEAKPSLSPAQVKEIIQKTATNMPSRQSWEVGAGYVNAYAAIDKIYRNAAFGSTVNSARTFTSSVDSQVSTQNFSINYNPALTTNNQITFSVASGTNSIDVKMSAGGLLGQTGNSTNLILTDPAGTQYRSGIPVAFALSSDRSVAVASPKPGVWTLKADGLQGVALPETVTGTITLLTASGTSGLRDIVGHPAEASIKMAVSNRLVDGIYGEFRPNESLKRIHLADYLTMGQAIRQFFPTEGTKTFFDVEGTQVLLAEAVTAKGGALRDNQQKFNGVMLPKYKDIFSPWDDVNRVSLTYSLVQSLGLQEAALARIGKPISVTVNGETLTIEDASSIPAGLEGYVSVALELNLINAFFTASQGPYDLKPTLHATFKPGQTVSRADFAVIVTRTFPQWEALTQPGARVAAQELARETTAYPNPFSGSTTISYTLPQEEHVTVEVSSVLGYRLQTLVNEQKPAGRHQVNFDGNGLMPGNYLISVKTPTGSSSRRVVVK
ncbi:S8 family serine peptidase [Spirosoma sp. KUDC1026]|uniref:S8 family serine peptidase n=1 Tax=Spirosoma sp. KUDC1026 TaxID=2745947 RepID=UPI00159BC903|nr:S8 family serine peptidase [Spirosoma sp. KUDC1026]QKZ12971.1 S8 family peptidase [Spirosoma sp. KUDC1026]